MKGQQWQQPFVFNMLSCFLLKTCTWAPNRCIPFYKFWYIFEDKRSKLKAFFFIPHAIHTSTRPSPMPYMFTPTFEVKNSSRGEQERTKQSRLFQTSDHHLSLPVRTWWIWRWTFGWFEPFEPNYQDIVRSAKSLINRIKTEQRLN